MKRLMLWGFVALLGWGCVSPVSAAEGGWLISAGATRTPAGGGQTGAVVFADWVSDRGEAFHPVWSVGLIADKGTSQDQLNRNVLIGAGGVRWQSPWLWFVQFEVGAVSAHTQALSSTGQFVSSVGFQRRRVTFQIRHISNGGTAGRNAGETMALIGWSF